MTISAQDTHEYPIYNARFRAIFPILDADGDLVTGATTPDSEVSQDSGTFADATNEATEIATSSGVYFLDLIATETDTKSTTVIIKTATAGAKTTVLTLNPRRLVVVRSGTAQAGAASTITLDASASALDSYYNGCWVNITNNDPANVLGQARKITGYVGSTKVVTIQGTWGTNPSVASTFEVLVNPEAPAPVGWAGSAVVTPSVAGTPKVDVTHWIGTAAATPTVGGVPEVDLTHVAGATTDVSALATNVAAILVDTGTTLDTKIDTIDNFLDTEVAAILSDTNAILVDTGTTLDDFIDTEIATIITDIAAVKADTSAILVDTGTDGVALAAGAITSTKFAAGAIDTAAVGAGVVGAVDKNANFSNFEFLMVDSTDHVTPKTGLVVTGTRSIDGGAFAAVTGVIAEVANGIYQFDAVAGDTNGDLITWRFISATADDVFVTFRTVA